MPVSEDDIVNKSQVSEYESAVANAAATKSTEPDVVRGQINFDTALGRFAVGEMIENYISPVSKKPTTATRSLKFAKYPKYLLAQSRRFTIGDNWQPKKLNVSVEFPDLLDLEMLRADGVQEGESLIVNTDEPTVNIDEAKVNELVDMGYPYHAARKAIYHGNGNPEVYCTDTANIL